MTSSPTLGIEPRVGAHLVLRPIEDRDRPFLLSLYASTREEELAAVDWAPEERRAFLAQQFDAQDRFYRENYPGASLEVIESRGVRVGRLYVDRWPSEIRVMDLALVPEARRRGIGARLLRRLAAEGEAAGLPLSVHVERFNPALRLYRRLGFELAEDKGVYLLLTLAPGAIR